MYYIDNWLPLYYCELDSTQSEALRLISSRRAIHGNVVISDLQTSGYGKYNRLWVSDQQDLTVTLILQIAKGYNLAQLSYLSYVTAVAVANSVGNNHNLLPNQDIKLKWVNDVIVNGGKISGILLKRAEHFLIIGIGVNFSKKNLTDITISSINSYSNMFKQQYLEILLKEFKIIYHHFLDYGFEFIRNMWLKYSYEIGSNIYLKNLQGDIYGKYLGISNQGEVIIARASDNKIYQNDEYNRIEKISAASEFELL